MSWPFVVLLLSLSQARIYASEIECSCDLPGVIDYDTGPFQYDNNCYFALKEWLNFMNAARNCEKTYGQLIVFESVDEMKSVLPHLQCPKECPQKCRGKPCSPCKVKVCPVPASISYWINVHDGKYLRQDFGSIDIPQELQAYYHQPSNGDSLIYSRDFSFFTYNQCYRAKPFCKIYCQQRSNANNLTDSQIKELQNGLFGFYMDYPYLSLRNFMMLNYESNIRHRRFMYDQNSNVFFHWNRLFVLNFELLLQRKMDFHLGVPYWDWLSQKLPDLVKTEFFTDSMGKLRRNIFRGIPTNTTQNLPYRNPHLESILKASKCSMWADLRLALSLRDFCDFIQQYSTILSQILMLIGGNKVLSVANARNAIYDPLFILVLANSDRHFAMWRRMRLEEGLDANIKVCRNPDITSEPLEPFQKQFVTHNILNRYAYPKLVNSHGHLFYKYDTKESSVYAAKLNQECKVKKRKFYWWLKITFAQKIRCSALVTITITIPPMTIFGFHKIIYEGTVYILNHMNLWGNGKFKVYKDISHLWYKYRHLREQFVINQSFKYLKVSARKLKNPDCITSLVTVEGSQKFP